MSVRKKVYIAGPSEELFRTDPGEARIERIYQEAFEQSNLHVVFDWPQNIRRFHATKHASEADKIFDWTQSMRQCYTGIVEADVVAFCLIDGAPSSGMEREKGVSEFLGKETIFVVDKEFDNEATRAFQKHPFGFLSPERTLYFPNWLPYV
jgi:hypothetical protein